MPKKFSFERLLEYFKNDHFSLISWGITALIVLALFTFGWWWMRVGKVASDTSPEPTTATGGQPSTALPTAAVVSAGGFNTIARQLELKTSISKHQSFDVTEYQVVVGDSLYAIAKQFNIKPETLLYSNQTALKNNIENLRPGMNLTVPPVDGVLYTWQQGDTIQKVADEFSAKPDDILNWSGNNIDLTNPVIKAGAVVMIPGGQGKPIDWTQFIPTYTRSSTGTATSELGNATCGGGPVGLPVVWPTSGQPHTLSGNGYSQIHQGIDITAPEGTPVLAAGPGVVVYAGWNDTGYGNVIEIDHGNGYSSVYAHLENGSFRVHVCSAVVGGEQIANADSTGNSTGSHLHFEVRLGGVTKDPWDYVH